MAYSLHFQAFGIKYANYSASIIETGKGIPATILSDPSGGFLNSMGSAKLDTLGNLSVYIDDTKDWTITLFDENLTPEQNISVNVTTTDKEFVVTTYACVEAFVGAGVDDVITATQVLDVSSDTPVVSSTIWMNQSTGLQLASKPASSKLALAGASALTNTQLRASPIPVSLNSTSFPLAAGASTAALQQSILDRLPTLVNGKVPVETGSGGGTQAVSVVSLPLPGGAATETSLADLNSKIPASIGGRLPVEMAGSLMPVSAVSLPLPTGAATDATLQSVAAKLPTLINGRLPVDFTNSTQPISAASLPLPTGASSETTLASVSSTLTSLNSKTPTPISGRVPVDGSGVVQPVSVTALPLPSGAATEVTLSASATSLAEIVARTPLLSLGKVPVDGSGVVQPISVDTLPLPNGAATNVTLAAVGAKLPTLVSGRTPVDGSGVTQPVSAVSLPLPAGAATESSLAAMSNKLPALVSGKTPVDGSGVTQPVSAASLPLPSGAATESSLAAMSNKLPALVLGRTPVDGSGVTQPVSAASLPLPTGAATETTLVTMSGKLPSLVSGRTPVDGSGVTQPISVASLPLPSGAATETSLVSMSGKLPALVSGRTPVDGSGVIQPVSISTLPLPSGAATETTLAAVSGKLPTLVTGRTPVDGSGVTQPISAASLPLPAGAATETSLVSMSGKLPTLVSGRTPVDGSGVTQPVSVASLPLPSGAATETTLATVSGKLPALVSGRTPVDGSGVTQPVSIGTLPLPTGAATDAGLTALGVSLSAVKVAVEDLSTKTTAVNTGAIAGTVALDGPTISSLTSGGGGGLTNTQLRASPIPVAQDSALFVRVGFAEVGSGLVGMAATELVLEQTGTGMTVSQSAGNLVVATGTTVNSETIIRSIVPFEGAMNVRYKAILSQRIANQTFRFEMADLIGTGLSYTINSATSVTVTFPATNPFTAANVGQSLRLSKVTGAAGIPGRYAIASVSGLTVTFTVAAWPATGTGTLTLYGFNYIMNEYSGTTATSSSFDCQRRGWNSGVTAATINTTASPGHVAQFASDVLSVGLSDSLVASNTGYQWSTRASRVENVPDEDTDLYLFIVVQNGSTAPASTTSLTVGFVQVEDQPRIKVRVASTDPSPAPALVQVLGGSIGLTSGTVTANVGTNGMAVYTDSSTNLAASATFTGTARDGGATPAYSLFVAHAFADVAGTLRVEKSTDNVTWRLNSSAAVAAGVGVELTARVTARYYRAVFVNGAAAQTAFLLTSSHHRI